MFVFFGFQATVMQNEENKFFLSFSTNLSTSLIFSFSWLYMSCWICLFDSLNNLCFILQSWVLCAHKNCFSLVLLQLHSSATTRSTHVWEFFELFGKMMIKYNHVSVWFVWWKMVKFQTVFPILFTVGLKCGSCSGLTKCRIYLKKSILSWQKLNYHKL